MKILITGSNGQLGNELQSIIKSGKAEIGSVSENIKNSEVIALDVDKLDITSLENVKNVLNEEK
ncbi:sugar nucleotide-binding protein, partial [Clostridium perfringens]